MTRIDSAVQRFQSAKLRNERGSISIYCLVIALLAIMVTLSVSSESIDELHRSRGLSDGTTALAIAEAGVEYTLAQLRQSSTYSGTVSSLNFGNGSFATSVTIAGNGDHIVTSTGTLNNGVFRKVQVVVSDTGDQMFPNGAIVSNGGVTINGNGYTLTSPSTKHLANVRANGDIRCTGNASVDGSTIAAGTVSMIANSGATSRQSGAARMQFPDSTAIDRMQNKYASQARQGRTISGLSIHGSTIMIASPVYIDGSVTVTGKGKLIFTGPGPVYIAGSLSASGQSEIYNSGLIAVRDEIDMSGQGTYVATGDFNTCAMFSFSDDQSQAIKLSGQSSNTQMGIVYAVNGGVKITGNGSVFGAVIAGGSNSNVSMPGNANILYPAALTSGNVYLPKTSKVVSWVEL